jgi:hypothetical protein
MGIGVRPREHLERTGEGLCAGACTGLCCRCRLLVLRRRPALCCRRGAVLAPAAVADGPRACSLCACEGEGEPQRRPLQPYQWRRGATRREAGGKRREVGGGGTGVTNLDSVSAADLFLRRRGAMGPPAVSRASFPASRVCSARFFPAHAARDSFPLPARAPHASSLARFAFSTAQIHFLTDYAPIKLCRAIKRAPNHAQRFIGRLPPKRNVGPTFSV